MSKQDTELREKILAICNAPLNSADLANVDKYDEYLTDEIMSLITTLTDSYKREVAEAEKRGVEELARTITNSTGVSEMYGWPGQLEQLKERTFNRLKAQTDKDRN